MSSQSHQEKRKRQYHEITPDEPAPTAVPIETVDDNEEDDGERDDDETYEPHELLDDEADDWDPSPNAAPSDTGVRTRSNRISCKIRQSIGMSYGYIARFTGLEKNQIPPPDVLFGSKSRLIHEWKMATCVNNVIEFAFEATDQSRLKYTSAKQFLRVLGEIQDVSQIL